MVGEVTELRAKSNSTIRHPHEVDPMTDNPPTHGAYWEKDPRGEFPRFILIGTGREDESGNIAVCLDRLPYGGFDDDQVVFTIQRFDKA